MQANQIKLGEDYAVQRYKGATPYAMTITEIISKKDRNGTTNYVNGIVRGEIIKVDPVEVKNVLGPLADYREALAEQEARIAARKAEQERVEQVGINAVAALLRAGLTEGERYRSGEAVWSSGANLDIRGEKNLALLVQLVERAVEYDRQARQGVIAPLAP